VIRVMADLRVEVTCPECGHISITAMPTNRCVFSYDCPGCHATLRPKAGDCCVFCSYGDKACPWRQNGLLPPSKHGL
jgi:hypothetical protein